MDVIDRAIQRGNHVTDDPAFIGTTWEDFEKVAQGRKVYVFGLGMGAEFYCHKYRGRLIADAFIDNDPAIQGVEAGEILSVGAGQQAQIIQNPSALAGEKPENAVILITSLNHYQEIGDELRRKGFHSFFSVLCMEAAYRIYHQIEEAEDFRASYLREMARLPVNSKKVILVTVCDGAGHGKEIAKQLLSMCPELDIVWAVKDREAILPAGVRAVWTRNHKAYVRELATAKIWLTDGCGLPSAIAKRAEQISVELKHWAIVLKMVGYDEADCRNDEQMRIDVERMSRDIDYFIVCNEFDEMICRSGYHFTGKAVQVGSPRSDALFHAGDGLRHVRQAFSLPEDKHLLLYAPTFRLSERGWESLRACCDLNFSLVRDSLQKRFGGEWLVLLRLHPFVALHSREMRLPSYVIDVSGYYDAEELVAAADALVTDYSSIMYETAVLGRPVFLLGVDYKKFIVEQRDFYIPYEEHPFPIAASNEELARKIESFDAKRYQEDLGAFLQRYGLHEDGRASERAAEFISHLLDEKEIASLGHVNRQFPVERQSSYDDNFARDRAYWNQYYEERKQLQGRPSDFALSIIHSLRPRTFLLELGCGNGRDSKFFSKHDIHVTGIDASDFAIGKLKEGEWSGCFVCADFVKLHSIVLPFKYDYVYSRFTWHAITDLQEDELLENIPYVCNPEGKLFIEARTIHDKLYGVGTEIAENAFFQDGYFRRFIDPRMLCEKMESKGYNIVSVKESAGFSKTETEDPVLLRIEAKVPGI